MPKKIRKTAPKKPERVYRVVAKKPSKVTNKKTVPKTTRKRIHLLDRISNRSAVLVLIAVVFIFIGTTYIGVKLSNNAISKTNVATAQVGYSKDAARRMALIGTEKNYPNEIVNYQSAPEDLQVFMLKDYKLLKTNCIVNGNFAGTLSYEIVNVVYDSFARIEKNCAGKDTLILKKMSGVWTVIFSGNDLPECDDINAFNVPQGISYTCRDGFNRYTNPNP